MNVLEQPANLTGRVVDRCRVRCRRRLAGSVLAAGFYAAVLTILFWRAIFLGQVLYPEDILYQWSPWSAEQPAGWHGCENCLLGDEVQQYHPYAAYRRERLADGQLPLWDPYALSGTPFAASPQSALFYPINLLTLPLSLESSFVVSAFIRLLIAGLLTYLLARELGLSGAPSLLSGLAFMLCAYNVVWLGYPQVNATAFVPGVLLFVARLARGGGFPDVAGVALCVGFMILGGHPEECLHAAVLVLPFGTVVSLRKLPRTGRWRVALRRLAGIGAGAVLGVGLAAIQVLPFLDFLEASSTFDVRSFTGRSPFVLAPTTAATFFIPTFFGSPLLRWSWGPSNLNEACGYVGVATLCLAVASLTRIRRDWRVALFAGAAAFSLLVAYGAWPIFDLFTSIPGVRQVSNQRLLYVAELCLALLGGLGLETIARRRPSPRCLASPSVLAIGVTLGLAAIFGIVAGLATRSGPGATIASATAHGALFGYSWFVLMLAASTAILCLPRLYPKRGAALTRFAPLLLALDLLVTWTGYNPAVAPGLGYAQTPAAVRFLQRQPGPFRIAAVGFPTLAPDASTVYRLADVRGYDIPTLRRYTELFGDTIGPTNGIGYDVDRLTPRSMTFLSLLGARYILSPTTQQLPGLVEVFDRDVHVYENPRALPPAFFVARATIASRDAARAALDAPGFDPATTVVVEARPDATLVDTISRLIPAAWGAGLAGVGSDPPPGAGLLSPVPAGSNNPPAVHVRIARPEHLFLDVDAPTPGYVVIANAYDLGWHATLNGRAATVLPADLALQAVAVPAGHSQIELWYLPSSFLLGMLLTIVSAGVLGVGVWWGRRLPLTPPDPGTGSPGGPGERRASPGCRQRLLRR